MLNLRCGLTVWTLWMSCAALGQEAVLSSGAPEMAGALLQRHAYVCENADRAALDKLHRDLREAKELIRRSKAEGHAEDALAKYKAASERLEQLLQSCPRVQTVHIAGQPLLMPSVAPVHVPGDAAAFLFRVEHGDGPVRYLTPAFDLREDAGEKFSVEVRDAGTTWVLAALDRIPQGRTLLEFEFLAGGNPSTRVPVEIITTDHGMLDMRVLSDDSARPTPAMVRLVWKTDGSELRPANALDLRLLFGKQGNASGLRRALIPGKLGANYWCIPGPFKMALAPGEYEVTILRGIEHVPEQDTFTVQSNQTIERTYQPRRWIDMRKLGWYSGDDHVHAQMLSDGDARMVMDWIQAEDVHLANVVKMGDIHRTSFEQRGFGKAFRVEDHGYILSPGQECPRTYEMGHTLSMNITRMVRDTELYFLYDTVFDEVHRQGGLTGYAHVNADLFQVHRDMSINIPKEKADFVELLQFASLGTGIYYDFLNLGFKVTASAGSDVPWGGSVGEVRVYAYTGKKRFTADRWFEAIRRGNTFVTNGIMIDLSVDGARPGDEVLVTENRPLRVKARAWGDPRRDLPVKLDLVIHGDPVKSVVSERPDQTSLEADFTVPAGNGFWIAAQSEGGGGSRAHTTPVYVLRKGLRFWKHGNVEELVAKREAALAEIEHVVAEAQAGRNVQGAPDTTREVTELAEQGPALLQRVQDARRLYADLREVAKREAEARK